MRGQYRAIVSVLVDQITIKRLDNLEVKNIEFAQVVWFRFVLTRGVYGLIFKMADGDRFRIVANSNFGKVGDFNGLVEDLKQAAEAFRLDEPNCMNLNKKFFLLT